MKKKTGLLPILCGLLFLFFSGYLLAEEQLMTKLFFDSWLQKQIQPLEDSISQLKGQYAVLHQEATQIRESLRVEIEIVIGQKTALVNGQKKTLDVAPLIINSRTMVPVRFVGEALGASFAWDEATRQVTFVCGQKEIVLYIEQKQAYINGEKVILDTAPVIVDGRTMVPLRFLSEHMGAAVDWYELTRTVKISG
ncbi:MAG TPA: copper amine oxidase N-terminal domain-containing protein [Peptococcaceae bacterium]|nr:copper amine oxidase N-terminal domain-containing protein [Peptococcaceae bacterium]HPZ71552.1 copper amine oxidase N-terminal domain-containing protein [Peptococcaceae bacterium]